MIVNQTAIPLLLQEEEALVLPEEVLVGEGVAVVLAAAEEVTAEAVMGGVELHSKTEIQKRKTEETRFSN